MTRTTIVAAAFLAACAVPLEPSPREPDVEVPETWAAEAGDARRDDTIPTEWWKAFGDERLDRLVAEALERNRDLHASAARLAAAVAAADVQGANLWPQLQATADGARGRQNFIGFPIQGGDVLSTTSSRYGLGLDLTWEIDLWGRIRAGALAAEADVEAAAAQFEGARLSIAAQTAKAWFAAAESEQQLRLAIETAQSFERSANRVRARFEAGTRSPLDLRLALVDLASARSLVERRRQQDEVARRALQVLIGRYPDAELTTVGNELEMPDAPIPAGLPSELLRRRPDLVAAERQLAAADARLAEARASLYPRLSLTASGGTASGELKDVADVDLRVWSLAANLVAPLFLGGRLRANVRLQDANRRAVLAEYGAVVLDAFRDVETALANEGLLAREETYRTNETRQAEAARALAEDRYDRGLEDIITLLASQRSALTARSRLLTVRRERLDNRIDLIRALGGGFPDSDEGAVER